MRGIIDLYSGLDNPDFDPYGNSAPKKVTPAPAKKPFNNNNNDKKPIIKNNNNFKINNNNNNNNLKKNNDFKSNNNNFKNNNNNFKGKNNNFKKINKDYQINFINNYDKFNDYEKDNNPKKNSQYEFNDDNDYNYDKNIISDPLSLFTSSKNKDEDNDDQNIIPGKQDIKSQIDIEIIESIIISLNDSNHRYTSIKELQDVLKKVSLTNNLNDEPSQAFLTYCWLTKNISYYIGPRADNTPLGALQKRVTQCSGYSRLFKELLKVFKIKSVLVHGIGRTYSLNPKPKKENHEWNAIKLNGEYYLCEVTWGSGKVENNKFVRNYNTFYFCCPPDIFIYTHFPSQDLTKWMLLDKKISQEEFENILYKDKYFYHYGFSDIQPNEGIAKLKNKNSTEVKFNNLNQVKTLRLSCKVYYEHKLLENISYIEKYENYFIVNLIFNKKGNYNVLYFSTDKTGTVNSELIARQQFYVLNDAKETKVFPTIFNFPDELYIREPKYNNLPRNKEILFRFSSNEIDDMGVVIDKKCMHLQKMDDNTFVGKFTISGDEILVGKFDIDKPGNLKVMIKYKVRK